MPSFRDHTFLLSNPLSILNLRLRSEPHIAAKHARTYVCMYVEINVQEDDDLKTSGKRQVALGIVASELHSRCGPKRAF